MGWIFGSHVILYASVAVIVLHAKCEVEIPVASEAKDIPGQFTALLILLDTL